ncbi:MAG: alpha-1,2-fucosyltransferase [Chthoniobacteraceae bacterium]
MSAPGGPLFIVAGKAGKLGNRLFLFSYVISLAAKLGGRVVNCGFSEYADSFAAPSRDALSRWPAHPSWLRGRNVGEFIYLLQTAVVRVARKLRLPMPGVKIVGLHEAHTAEQRIDHLPFLDSLRSARVIIIGGWIELSHVRFEQPDLIRAYFQPAERHRLAVAALIASARAQCDVLVGIHVRRGDYAGFLGGRYLFSLEAYEKNMRAAAALFPGRAVGFLICSNEPTPSLEAALPRCHRGTGQVVEDLYALAECDYLIGPPSTFSWWASFYGRKPLWEMLDATSEPTLAEFVIRF